MKEEELKFVPVSSDNPVLIKNDDLCAQCGHCLAVCSEEIGVANHYLQKNSLQHQEKEYPCINCGQCITVCPEGALSRKKHVDLVKKAIADPKKIVIFSMAPSVRVGLGDEFQKEKGRYVEEQAIAAMRRLGADYVFDVTFSADLTIMEEATELLQRITKKKRLPQFTSCCPAWVKYVETFHPDLIPHLSTAKSPISMQGAIIKTYVAKKKHLDIKNIVSVAVAPCTAKKFEITREELCDASKVQYAPQTRDNDYVLTTKELADWIKEEGIVFEQLAPSPFDELLGRGSGGGIIFGATGGVMEAALRMVYMALTNKIATRKEIEFLPVRGMEQLKEATVEIAGNRIRAAVAYGTKFVEDTLLNDLERLKQYDFIEVMTCPGGCISGAGQPGMDVVPIPDTLRQSRIDALYQQDQQMDKVVTLQNEEIKELYGEYLGAPLGELAERLLHTTYRDRSR